MMYIVPGSSNEVEWMASDTYTPSFRVQKPPFGRCWYHYIITVELWVVGTNDVPCLLLYWMILIIFPKPNLQIPQDVKSFWDDKKSLQHLPLFFWSGKEMSLKCDPLLGWLFLVT